MTAGPPVRRSAAQEAALGKTVYDRWCAGCHGDTGAGDGEAAAFMLPRPRDFTRAVYQIRSTASGELPTDADLRHVIAEGMPGTAMPGWKSRLSAAERDGVLAYIKSFSRFFDGASPEPLEFGRAPGASDEGLAEGARVYRELECFKCHGDAGRGDGPSAPTMTDDWDAPIRPADLTRRWTFNGGGTVEDIYRRLRTGLDGTPMPSFSDAVEGGVVTDQQLWRVAQYVRALGREWPPVRDVIRAVHVERLPAGPADSAWNAVETFFIPMVGQIIRRPRWFTPTVDALWVRAAHDGERVALQLAWSDPSRSPDPSWQDWLTRVAATTHADGAPDPVQGPDGVVVQFPEQAGDGNELPYFLGGDTRRPVHEWHWTSDPDGVTTGRATGLGTLAATRDGGVVGEAAFADGRWQVQLVRTLMPADTLHAPTFRTGTLLPVAFRVADGSNGENGIRGAVSAWYGLYLDVPQPPTVFLAPITTALLTVFAGVLVVWRAQRRERGS
jgi:DMSO reductase family type II enzyme heme b subunit